MWLKLLVQLWNTGLGDLIFTAIKNILLSFKDNKGWLNELSEQAKQKVAELETKYPVTAGDKKYLEASKYLKDYAAAKGMTISSSVLNFLIEAALQAL